MLNFIQKKLRSTPWLYIGNQIKRITRLSFSTNSYLFALHAYAFLGGPFPQLEHNSIKKLVVLKSGCYSKQMKSYKLVFMMFY